MKKITFFIFCFSIMLAHVFSQAGDLDSAFGLNGKASTDFGGIYDFAYSVALQSDGKILVAGRSSNVAQPGFGIIRYLPNGHPDRSFGVNGKVITNIGGIDATAHDITVQTDGKILAAGSAYNGANNDIALVRYNNNGTLDSSFGINGIVTTAIGNGYDEGTSIALLPTGKIIVAGYADDGRKYDFALLRYKPNGALDKAFGNNGIVLTDLGGVSNYASSMTLQSDGKIVVAGTIAFQSTNSNMIVTRHNPNGTLDSSFGVQGVSRIEFGKYSIDNAHSVAMQKDGRIVLAGYADFKFAVARLLPNGIPDLSFGYRGKASTAIGTAGDYGYEAVIQKDGKIVVVGSTTQGSYNYFALVRYKRNGTVDSTFGNNGIVITSFYGHSDYGRGAVIQPDNKILAAGYVSRSINSRLTYDYGVARYISGLQLNKIVFESDNNSIFISPNPVHRNEELSYVLTKDENISIMLCDMNGKVWQIFFTNEKRTKGFHKEKLIFNSSLPLGNYWLVLLNGKEKISVQVVKE